MCLPGLVTLRCQAQPCIEIWHVEEFPESAEVKVLDAIPVQPGTRGALPQSRFAKASRLLQHGKPVPQPTSADTEVAPYLRGMGDEKSSAMAEGTELMGRRRRELEEGPGSGSWGDIQAQPNDRRNGYGQRLGMPPEVRVPAAPFRSNPLVCKRLVPAVNAVERGCHGSACEGDVTESPRLEMNVHGDSAAFRAFLTTVYQPWLIVCHRLQKRRRYRR